MMNFYPLDMAYFIVSIKLISSSKNSPMSPHGFFLILEVHSQNKAIFGLE